MVKMSARMIFCPGKKTLVKALQRTSARVRFAGRDWAEGAKNEREGRRERLMGPLGHGMFAVADVVSP